MALKLYTAPAEEPVTLAEAKVQCRVDSDLTTEDTLINGFITAARIAVENIARRALVTQTWELVLDDWPDSPFEIPRPPLASIVSITYKDENGVQATVSSADYVVDTDSAPGRVALKSTASWPTVTLYPIAGVRVRFTAGFGAAAAVPWTYKLATLLLVGHYYENRAAIETSGAMPKEVPFGVEALLWQDRAMGFP